MKKFKASTLLLLCMAPSCGRADGWNVERFLRERPPIKEVAWVTSDGKHGEREWCWGHWQSDGAVVYLAHHPVTAENHLLQPGESIYIRRGHERATLFWDEGTQRPVLWQDLTPNPGLELSMLTPYGPYVRAEDTWAAEGVRCLATTRVIDGGVWRAIKIQMAAPNHVFETDIQFDYSEIVAGGLPKRCIIASKSTLVDEPHPLLVVRTISKLVLGTNEASAYDWCQFLPRGMGETNAVRRVERGGRTYEMAWNGTYVPLYADTFPDAGARPPEAAVHWTFLGVVSLMSLGVTVWLLLLWKQRRKQIPNGADSNL